MEHPNTASLAARLLEAGATHREIMLSFRGFNAYAEAFRKESDAHE
jgi:hypothetical protein